MTLSHMGAVDMTGIPVATFPWGFLLISTVSLQLCRGIVLLSVFLAEPGNQQAHLLFN